MPQDIVLHEHENAGACRAGSELGEANDLGYRESSSAKKGIGNTLLGHQTHVAPKEPMEGAHMQVAQSACARFARTASQRLRLP
jgi:hypothetical protein